jgi:hypothetical protein
MRVENRSLFEQAKDLSGQMQIRISRMDLDLLSHEERSIISELKRLAADARLDVRDYEYAQTRAEQLEALHEAKERLDQLHDFLLKASGQNLFSAVDTAQFSALIQVIISQLQ